MNSDKSIYSYGHQEDDKYFNNLALAICFNDNTLEKYENIVMKKYGEDVYKNIKIIFVEELQIYARSRNFTNTSIIKLNYLGKNIGISEGTINRITYQTESKQNFQ